MADMALNTPGLYAALANRMDYLVARQGVVAGNIANADTPGYLAKDLEFKTVLQAQGGQLGMTAANSGVSMQPGASGPAGVVTQSARFIQHNGNAVRLDNEMVKLQQTQLDYRMATQLYAAQATMQKIALGKGQ